MTLKFGPVLIPRERRCLLLGHDAETVVTDGTTGEICAARVFVALLGTLNYAYLEATGSRRLPDWRGSYVHTLGFFGGCTEL